MKIRNGFVSNSSSSSFCIIGVTGSNAQALAVAEGKDYSRLDGDDYHEGEDYLGYGYDKGEVLDFYGGDSAEYAGIDAEELLEKYTIPIASKYFQQLVKEKLGVEIPLNQIGLRYGEAGNG